MSQAAAEAIGDVNSCVLYVQVMEAGIIRIQLYRMVDSLIFRKALHQVGPPKRPGLSVEDIQTTSLVCNGGHGVARVLAGRSNLFAVTACSATTDDTEHERPHRLHMGKGIWVAQGISVAA